MNDVASLKTNHSIIFAKNYLMKNQILLINNEQQLSIPCIKFMIANNYCIKDCHSVLDAIHLLQKNQINLIILVIREAKSNDAEKIMQLKKLANIPIIILSQNIDKNYLIHALELGVKDYLPIDVDPREALARINVNIDKTGPVIKNTPPTKLNINNVVLCPKTRTVFCLQQKIKVTGLEFELLYFLMKNAGKIASRELISQRVLLKKITINDRSLDMHISNLRKKLAQVDNSKKIQTVRGQGYIFLC